jgi:hypothetical protein
VRSPKSLAFPDSVREVSIVREGKRLVIAPSNAVWDDFFDSPGVDLPAQIRADGVAISQIIYRLGLSLDKHPRVLRGGIPKPGLTIDRLSLKTPFVRSL